MAKLRMRRHALKPGVDLMLASGDAGGRPLHDVVLEHSFMQLVQDIRSYAYEDVGMGKIGPKGLDWAKAFLSKPCRQRSFGRLLQLLRRRLVFAPRGLLPPPSTTILGTAQDGPQCRRQ
ncbi:hypothetical protein PsYK624_124740 [Phanerochaete sordida]|uniref:Uncharacterized protein n=1 Tax=Phanerochaete sordida TaxID=48140 RepID=A0A9P3LIE4_9APHY|nr:hypothetical protein PsYK624_124740 [Phanerochaete sordida]